MRISWIRSALVITCVMSTVLSSASSPQNASSTERQLFDAVNRGRTSRGIPTLRWDEALAAAARSHALEMAKRGGVAHQFPGEPNLPTRAQRAGVRYTSLAEDVDQGPNAGAIHQRLMSSPLHRDNILDSSYNSVGIGVAGHDGGWFVVEDFSKAK